MRNGQDGASRRLMSSKTRSDERRDDMRMVADGSDLLAGGYRIRNEFRTIIVRRRKKAEGESELETEE